MSDIITLPQTRGEIDIYSVTKLTVNLYHYTKIHANKNI